MSKFPFCLNQKLTNHQSNLNNKFKVKTKETKSKIESMVAKEETIYNLDRKIVKAHMMQWHGKVKEIGMELDIQ